MAYSAGGGQPVVPLSALTNFLYAILMQHALIKIFVPCAFSLSRRRRTSTCTDQFTKRFSRLPPYRVFALDATGRHTVAPPRCANSKYVTDSGWVNSINALLNCSRSSFVCVYRLRCMWIIWSFWMTIQPAAGGTCSTGQTVMSKVKIWSLLTCIVIGIHIYNTETVCKVPLPSPLSRHIGQKAQLPRRNSASAAHVYLGWLTDRAMHRTPQNRRCTA